MGKALGYSGVLNLIVADGIKNVTGTLVFMFIWHWRFWCFDCFRPSHDADWCSDCTVCMVGPNDDAKQKIKCLLRALIDI